MTDVPVNLDNLPHHLGTRFSTSHGALHGHLALAPAMADRNLIPMASFVYLVDVVAGVATDSDPDAWSFTSQLSVRRPAEPGPARVDAASTMLREGRRSATCEVPLLIEGVEWGTAFAAFSRVPRRETDPPKPPVDTLRMLSEARPEPLDRPLRHAAGFVSADPAGGVVTAELRAALLNPAGALQGAIVAGLAEAAAEDLADHHRALGTDRHVVVEIDVFYLAQNRVSPVATRARFVGPPTEGLVRVDLVDDGGRGRITTAVTARLAPAPS